MAIDLFGPVGAARSVAARPGEPMAGPTDTWFRDCIGGAPNTGTTIPANWLNRLTAQMRRIVRLTGVSENNADDDMVSKAIQSGRLNYAEDFGSADTLVANLPVAPNAYADGLLLAIRKNAAPNTGPAPTLNVNGLGPRTISRLDGSPVSPGDLPSGGLLFLGLVGGSFRLIGLAPGLSVVYVEDGGGASDALAGPASPPFSGWVKGQVFVTRKGGYPNYGATPTLDPDGRGPRTIVRRDGSPLAAGDLPPYGAFAAVFDGANVRLVGMVASEVQASGQSLIINNMIVGGRLEQYASPGVSSLGLPAGTPFEVEECRGGGGGGGGSNGTSAAGSGGGGGGRARAIYVAETAVVLTINVGAGGAGGAAGGGNGSAGGTTSVVVASGVVRRKNGATVGAGGTLCAATGGGFGYGSTSAGQTTYFGAGGVASGGELNDPGDAGGYPYPIGSTYIGGAGGGSPGSGGSPTANLGFGGNSSTAAGIGGNGSSANAVGGPGTTGRVTIKH